MLTTMYTRYQRTYCKKEKENFLFILKKYFVLIYIEKKSVQKSKVM